MVANLSKPSVFVCTMEGFCEHTHTQKNVWYKFFPKRFRFFYSWKFNPLCVDLKFFEKKCEKHCKTWKFLGHSWHFLLVVSLRMNRIVDKMCKWFAYVYGLTLKIKARDMKYGATKQQHQIVTMYDNYRFRCAKKRRTYSVTLVKSTHPPSSTERCID